MCVSIFYYTSLYFFLYVSLSSQSLSLSFYIYLCLSVYLDFLCQSTVSIHTAIYLCSSLNCGKNTAIYQYLYPSLNCCRNAAVYLCSSLDCCRIQLSLLCSHSSNLFFPLLKALVLAPTRELARQSHSVIQAISYYLDITVYACIGGQRVSNMAQILRSGVHVVIGRKNTSIIFLFGFCPFQSWLSFLFSSLVIHCTVFCFSPSFSPLVVSCFCRPPTVFFFLFVFSRAHLHGWFPTQQRLLSCGLLSELSFKFFLPLHLRVCICMNPFLISLNLFLSYRISLFSSLSLFSLFPKVSGHTTAIVVQSGSNKPPCQLSLSRQAITFTQHWSKLLMHMLTTVFFSPDCCSSGTPGRVKHMVDSGALCTDYVKTFVLDEVDIMLSEGFKEQVYPGQRSHVI